MGVPSLFPRFWLPVDLSFGIVWGGPGATILLQGDPWRPFKSLLELSWHPLVAPGPLWAPFGTRYGASGRTSCCARIPSKVRVLAHLGTAKAPLLFWGSLWRPLGLLLGSLERSCSSLGHIQRSPGALGAIFISFCHTSLSVLFLCSRGGSAMCDPYTQAHVS